LPLTLSQSLAEIAERGTHHLERVIAIDSHSDERSETIPSTPGQRELATFLAGYFEGLGFEASVDSNANLIVDIPANTEGTPTLAFMVHMDTSRGTEAVPHLETLPAWNGARIPFPRNELLQVSVENYPETATYLGQDLLFGPGDAPIGLDDKLGLAEMMTMAEILAKNPSVPHGALVLVCRPDEEIGRMAAVEGLADVLKARGVRYGYTVDGLAPFEVNVENFNAARARVRIAGRPLELAPLAHARRLTVVIHGAKSHGATAKAEGYQNATSVFTRALAPLSRRNDIIPVGFQSDHQAEVNATLAFIVRGDDDAALDAAERALKGALEGELAPHAWKGARLEVVTREDVAADAPLTDEVMRLFAHLATFFRVEGPSPKLSEESDGYDGYSNPCFVEHADGAITLEYRLRDFTDDGLAARKRHVEMVCKEGPGELPVTITDQYVNMGKDLAPFPELVEWAEAAALSVGRKVLRRPIRGGTGVDPFLARGIPVANVGTGYFAPESEKEFTSRQNLADHALWLVHLVATVAERSSS